MAETIPTRVYSLERDRDRQDRALEEHGERIDRVESRMDVFGAKLGVYAAMGALFGSGIVSGIVAVFLH